MDNGSPILTWLPGVMVSIQQAQHLQLSLNAKQEAEEIDEMSPVHIFKRLVTEDVMPTDSFQRNEDLMPDNFKRLITEDLMPASGGFERLFTEDLMPSTPTDSFDRLCTEEAWPVYGFGGKMHSFAEEKPQAHLAPQASQLAQQIQLAQLVNQVAHEEPQTQSEVPAAPVAPPVPLATDGARIRRRPRRRGRGNGGETQVGDGSPSTGSLGHPLHCGKACGYFHRAKGCRDGAACPNCHICWPSEGSKNHPLQCKQACKYNLRAKGCREGSTCKCCHLCTWSREADSTVQSDGSESTRTS